MIFSAFGRRIRAALLPCSSYAMGKKVRRFAFAVAVRRRRPFYRSSGKIGRRARR